MTGPQGAPMDPPCTVAAGGAIYPMVAANGRAALAVYGADEQLQCLYILGDDEVLHLDHCTGCLPGVRGERIEVTMFGRLPCGHV